jgi:hypothetical protein
LQVCWPWRPQQLVRLQQPARAGRQLGELREQRAVRVAVGGRVGRTLGRQAQPHDDAQPVALERERARRARQQHELVRARLADAGKRLSSARARRSSGSPRAAAASASRPADCASRAHWRSFSARRSGCMPPPSMTFSITPRPARQDRLGVVPTFSRSARKVCSRRPSSTR